MTKKSCYCIAIMFAILTTISVIAGPTIIRDNRIKDLALTPVLGRGYTIVTNTFQSKCLDNVVVTDPSYDFQYKFESLEQTKSLDTSTSSETSVKGTYVPYDLTVDISSKATFASGKKEFYHNIYVEINMDTYYASVDEARSRMSDSAATLLQNKDLPGFFSSCGSYYVRSLGRNAKFVSVFTYTDISETRDMAFEAALEISVKGFGGRSAMSSQVTQQAGTKKLTITAQAWGLGKNEGATLISYDLETFKAAIKDAFISMQNPMTGKVTSMEVVPWVENTEFQKLIDLEKEVTDPATGKTMLLYKKKHILNLNAEFLAEIERADRNMMNIFYKAKICKQTIDASWASGGKLLPEYQNIDIINNKFPGKTMKLGVLYNQHLKLASIEKLLTDEEAFMYKLGAQKCMDTLLESGMFIKSWRKVPPCVKIRGELSKVMSEIIDDYCMPNLARPPEKEEKPPRK